MDTRRMTALVLMIFPVVAIAGWFGFGLGVMGGVGRTLPLNIWRGWVKIVQLPRSCCRL